MSLSDQMKSLLSAGAAMRKEIWGVTPGGEPQQACIEEKDGTRSKMFPCYFSSGKTTEALMVEMFKEMHDNIVRANLTDLVAANVVPANGKTIRLLNANQDGTDLLVRIEDIQGSAINPELVMGCKQI